MHIVYLERRCYYGVRVTRDARNGVKVYPQTISFSGKIQEGNSIHQDCLTNLDFVWYPYFDRGCTLLGAIFYTTEQVCLQFFLLGPNTCIHVHVHCKSKELSFSSGQSG